jgi:hypothetical protein
MKNAFFTLLGCLAMVAMPLQLHAASPSRPATPTAIPSVDPRILARAKEWFHRFQTGEIDRSQLNAQVNKELTSEMVAQEAATLKALGQPSSFVFIRTYPIRGLIGYDFLLQFKSARIIEMIAFDAEGKIAGIDFAKFVRTVK